MTARHHQRGRNTHWSDGRPAGFGMKLEAAREPYLMRFTTFAGIAIAVAALFYFGGTIALRGWK